MAKTIGLIIASSFFTIFVSVISGLSAWWLNDYVDRPEIDWYSRPHYKIGNIAIGNIYLTNSGRKTDTNIAVTLDAFVSPEDIKIVDLTSDYSIKNNDQKTTINIKSLNPGEGADITYRDKEDRDDIAIYSMTSDASNFHYAFDEYWWNFSPPIEIILVMLVMGIGFVFGLFLKRPLYRLLNTLV